MVWFRIVSSWILASLQTELISIIVLHATYALSILYSLRLKNTGLLGNIIVTFCVSTALIYGSLTATGGVDPLVLNIAGISFFINLGREVIQSVQDMKGDMMRGVKSVAITHGLRAAAVLGSLFMLLGVILGPLVLLNQLTGLQHHYILILIPQFGLVYSIIMLLRQPTQENASRFIRHANTWTGLILFMLAALFAFSLL